MLDLNNLQTKQTITRYYQQPQFTQPPPAISHLYTPSNNIPKMHYLYQHFSKNSAIPNKRKRLVLVDLFHQLLNNINNIIDQFIDTTASSDMVSSFLMKIINIPNILINYDPSKNLFDETYRWLVDNISCFNEAVRLDLINRLVTLGQVEGMFEKENKHVIDIVKRRFTSIVKNQNILVYLARIRSGLFSEIMESLEVKVRVKMIEKMLFCAQLQPSYASTLDNVSLPSDKQQLLLEGLLASWTSINFLEQNPYTQKLVTNFIVLKMRRMSVEYLARNLPLINKGITERFEYSKGFQFVRESGLMVWKAYVKGTGLGEEMGSRMEELAKRELFVDDVEPEKDKVKAVIMQGFGGSKITYFPKQNQTNQPQKHKILNQQQEEVYDFQPKNLLDCYMGLLSDNSNRKQACLKSINQLVRTHQPDIAFTFSKLLTALLFTHDSTSSIRSFDQLRVSAVTSMIIHQPLDAIKIMTDRFYNKQCCVADKIMIINSLNSAVEELANNPKKYEIEGKENDKDKQFYFKRVTSKYYDQTEADRKEKEGERQSKLEGKSRRWGHTRIQHQSIKLSLSQSSTSSLIPIKSTELFIHDPFINRLYELVDQIFFTFVYKIPSLGHLLKDVAFVESIFGMLNTFLTNVENYHNKYRIIEQALDIVTQITDKNPQIQKSRLGVLLKVVGVLDSNVNYHGVILIKINELLKEFYEYQKKSYDPSVKIILGIVEERLGMLMEAPQSSNRASNFLLISQV